MKLKLKYLKALLQGKISFKFWLKLKDEFLCVIYHGLEDYSDDIISKSEVEWLSDTRYKYNGFTLITEYDEYLIINKSIYPCVSLNGEIVAYLKNGRVIHVQ